MRYGAVTIARNVAFTLNDANTQGCGLYIKDGVRLSVRGPLSHALQPYNPHNPERRRGACVWFFCCSAPCGMHAMALKRSSTIP